MQIVTNIDKWQELCRQFQSENKSIGFVATMGNLHHGHASLLQRSLAENDITVLSIFVNPTQFNDPKDLAKYPRTFDQDCELAKSLGVDVVFAPDPKAMYPDDYHYQVHENDYSKILDGEFRPGHFTGMLTVVLKLLLLIKPKRAYFGEKDYQQLQLIRGMATAFFLDLEIVACETKRNASGLALSSRNNLLTPQQLEQASLFPELLNTDKTPAQITQALIAAGFKVEYIVDHADRRFGAVILENVRLIDNIQL